MKALPVILILAPGLLMWAGVAILRERTIHLDTIANEVDFLSSVARNHPALLHRLEHMTDTLAFYDARSRSVLSKLPRYHGLYTPEDRSRLLTEARSILDRRKENEPNKTMETTPVGVTIPATQEVAPPTSVSHL